MLRYLRRRRHTKKGRARVQGTTPRRTPFATIRAGVSCIAAKATATCSARQAAAGEGMTQTRTTTQLSKQWHCKRMSRPTRHMASNNSASERTRHEIRVIYPCMLVHLAVDGQQLRFPGLDGALESGRHLSLQMLLI